MVRVTGQEREDGVTPKPSSVRGCGGKRLPASCPGTRGRSFGTFLLQSLSPVLFLFIQGKQGSGEAVSLSSVARELAEG